MEGGKKTHIRALQNGENSIANKKPEWVPQWHPTRNGNLKPTDVTPGFEKDIWWHCSVCQQDWPQPPAERNRSNSKCPFCTGRKYCRGVNDIRTKYPAFADAWDHKNNGDLKPEDFRFHDDTEVWWICPNCKKSYPAKIRNAIDSGSPLCGSCKQKKTKREKKQKNNREPNS